MQLGRTYEGRTIRALTNGFTRSRPPRESKDFPFYLVGHCLAKPIFSSFFSIIIVVQKRDDSYFLCPIVPRLCLLQVVAQVQRNDPGIVPDLDSAEQLR
jgi:hypothetical protein